MIDNDFESFASKQYTNNHSQHTGLYLSLNDGDVVSRRASLNVLTGIKNLYTFPNTKICLLYLK